MITIAFVDTLGLCYDGDTLNRRGLGGSESAVISMSRELANLGYKVYVFNDCTSDDCRPGVYNGVTYEPINNLNNYNSFDVFIGSRSVVSFVPDHMKHEFKWATDLPNIERVSMESSLRILWMHDTFCDGDDYIEELVTSGRINKIFTLSDWHTTYITNCHHGRRRHYETLKRHIFQTRNGINLYHNEIDISAKDPDLFVYNSSVTKGMIPLVENIWPKVQERYPNAKLTIVGGFYRFRSDHGPDEQELTHRELVKKHEERGVTFTGIINQKEIADLLAKASYMIYPSAFPETFGISTLESLAYNTPLITCNQGALEETAIDLACYKMNYAIEPNVLFTEIDLESQCEIFVDLVSYAYENKYLHQQKMYACNQVKPVCEWSTVAVEWKRFFCDHVDNHYMPVDEYRKYLDINDTVNRVFNRHTQTRRSLRVRKQPEQPIKIVLPVYNSENYIKRCLDSILCQDYDNYEIIVIDDCSTDSTLEIVKSFNDDKIKLISRQERMGAVYNQVNTIKGYCDPNDITILIDGDDWLVNDPHVFDYVNHLYHEGAEFTYGSCWSLADGIPLIAQPYPEHIKKNKDYRSHKFNWGMPYTHLRTFKSNLIINADNSNFKNSEGKWYQAGGDNSVFFTAIEGANPENVICVSELLYVYNDLNPLNDYKVNGEEQTKNANEIINSKKSDNISVIAPTMWRCKDIFKSMLEKLTQHDFIEEIIIFNNEVESTPDWEVLSHPKVILTKLGVEDKNYYVNPCWNKGVELSKSNKICFLNDDVEFDLRLIDKIYYELTPDKGVFGLITGEEHHGHPVVTDGSIEFKKWNHNLDPESGERGDNIHGFGQLMFLRKENWLPIIDGLDIYFGDDYIFHSQLMKNLDNYLIVNINWNSPMASTSADQSIVGGFFDREKVIFGEWIVNNELNLDEIKKRIDLQAQNELTAVSNVSSQPIDLFIYVSDIPGWQMLLSKSVDRMKKSGLWENVDRVYIQTHYNKDMKNQLPSNIIHNNLIVEHCNESTPSTGEIDHVCYMQDWVSKQTETRFVLKYHLKGVTKLNSTYQDVALEWKEYLDHWCIDHWRLCVQALEQGYDTAGANWHENPGVDQIWGHWSGNIWWATSDYLSTLTTLQAPDKVDYEKQLGGHSVRHDSELWIGSGKQPPRLLELHHYEHGCVYEVDTPKNYYKQPDSYSNLNDFFENKQNTFGETKMNNSSTKKILLAVPTNKNIEVETFKSIYDLEVPDGYEIEFQYFYGYQIDQIRNLIAEWAKHYDYLFSVDSDIVLPKDSLKKLLEADKDIVSGLYIQRIPNTHTLEVYKATDNGGSTNIDIDEIDFSQSLHEIVGCGFGCVLIKGEVFRVMEYPHFVYKSALNHQDTVSEDTYFCIKAREYGFQIFMDVTIQCEHVGSAKFLVEPPKKYSVIIPTMWRSLELTKKALIGYIENPLVGEVILIDNDKSRTPDWDELKHEKICLLAQEKNIFVNPAWNLGVQESKYDLICIANDDIVVDPKVFDRLKNEITVDKGMFGLNAGITEIGQPPITDGSIDLQEWRVGNNIHCFGQFMFIHKNNWLPIMDGLDVSMGEDFQFHIQLMNGRKNYMICNCFFEGVENERNGVVYYGGTTSTDQSIVSNTWDKEIKLYEEWFLANPAPEEYRINHLYSH